MIRTPTRPSTSSATGSPATGPAAPRSHLCHAALAAALAGCGGGGSDAAPAATEGSTAPPGLTSPESPAAPSLPMSGCGLTESATEALALLNQVRARGASCGTRGVMPPAAALAWSAPLLQAASGHSADMRDRNYVAHTSPDGRGAGDRALEAGYAWRSLAENIAAGQRTLPQVIDAWLTSDGHCANLMNASMRDMALSCQGGGSGIYPTYWTLMLGTAR